MSNKINYDVIIAHGPGCNDGATSAWAVWRTLPKEYRKRLEREGGFYYTVGQNEEISTDDSPFLHPNSPEGAIKLQEKGFPVVFVFIQPSSSVPVNLIAGKNVLILDLDMGDALVSVVNNAAFTFLCDHHDSTPQTLQKHGDILFGQNRDKFAYYVNTNKQECGATLTWRITHNTEIPPFVQVVRIGDTWMWKDYPELHAKFVLTALYMKRAFRSFPDIEETFQTWDSEFNSYVEKGTAVSEYEKSIIKQMAKQCDLGYIQTNDGTMYTVAYTQASVLHSEVGSTIKWYAEKRFRVPIDFCATWKYASHKNIVSISLRDPRPGLNLSIIARNIKNGDGKGGGHPEASGFSFFGLENFHNFIIKLPISESKPSRSRSASPPTMRQLSSIPLIVSKEKLSEYDLSKFRAQNTSHNTISD